MKKLTVITVVFMLAFCANSSFAQTQITGDWYSTACGDPSGVKWHFGNDNTGFISVKDCNGICGPIILNFSYTVSGNTLKTVYDVDQPNVTCTGYDDHRPDTPKPTSQDFELKDNQLTVSYGGVTTVFTRN